MKNPSIFSWHQVAIDISLDGRAFIQGQRYNAQAGQTFACYSPIDG